jgi:hypothetical protein
MKWKRKHKGKLFESESLIYAHLSMDQLYKLQKIYDESGKLPKPGCSRIEEMEYLRDEAKKQIEEVIKRKKLNDRFKVSRATLKIIPLNKGPILIFFKAPGSYFRVYRREREEFQIRIDTIISCIEKYSEGSHRAHPCRKCEYTFIETGVKQRSGKVTETYLYCLNCGAAYTYYTEPPEYPEGLGRAENDSHYVSMLRPCFDTDVILDENW